jgi:hypothetical protein
MYWLMLHTWVVNGLPYQGRPADNSSSKAFYAAAVLCVYIFRPGPLLWATAAVEDAHLMALALVPFLEPLGKLLKHLF